MAFGMTGAFFSDTEMSLGNLFTAGALDLKVDNDSYYNGNRCVENEGAGENDPNYWVWEGTAPFPVPGTPCDTSWKPDDLNNGAEVLHKFFNFADIKPDDEGEDTISLEVENDAWMCMDVALTSNDDFSSTEPELLVPDVPEDNQDNWDGELAQAIQMFWWADDGDNVYEDGEPAISNGIETLYNLATTSPFSVAIADSDDNIWGTPGPVPAGMTRYIGKAWCFGTLTLNPVAAGQGDNPSVASGVSCNGAGLGNETQTDSAKLDVSFSAVQARHNTDFQCEGCTFDVLIDLLIDGRFETPEVTHAAKWDVFPSVAGGWNVEWRDVGPTTFGAQNRPAIANLELHENVLGAAFEGDQYAELDTDWGGPSSSGTGEPSSVSIYRNFATIPGADYVLKYHFAPRPNTPAAENNLEVKIDGVISDTTGPTAGGGGPIAWAERTVNFTAGDASTEIRLTDLGTSNSLGTFLDNVRLYQISCPSD